MSGGGSTDVLVLGCNGLLGSACMRAFSPKNVGCDFCDFDVSDRVRALTEIVRLRPKSIINCAAATDVDRCEADHDYADQANAVGARNVAEAAARVGSRLIHISTDFVFDGLKDSAYVETDKPNPINYYGRSKLQGERAVLNALPTALVVRTSWLYGLGGAHFPEKVIGWAVGRDEVRVACDQIGSPTYAEDLAAAIRVLAATGVNGLLHLAGAGCASRLEWARETAALAAVAARVVPTLSLEFPLPAPRPKNTCLECSKADALGVGLPPWRDGLARYLRRPESS